MKIVFWNLQGGEPKTDDLLALFESWGADFVLIAEVPKGFRQASTKRREQPIALGANRNHAVNWTVQPTSNGQPMAIVYREGCQLASCVADPEPSRQAIRQCDVRPLVRLVLRKGQEQLSVVTCHAPYQGGGAAPYTYTTAVMQILNRDPHQVDIWMGDINTYANAVPGRNVERWRLLLSSPTSNRATGSPLDKIIVRAGFPACTVGRIIPTGGAAAPAGGAPAANDQMEPSWPGPASIPSDHAPIYLNTNHGLPPAAGAMDLDDDADDASGTASSWFREHGLK